MRSSLYIIWQSERPDRDLFFFSNVHIFSSTCGITRLFLYLVRAGIRAEKYTYIHAIPRLACASSCGTDWTIYHGSSPSLFSFWLISLLYMRKQHQRNSFPSKMLPELRKNLAISIVFNIFVLFDFKTKNSRRSSKYESMCDFDCKYNSFGDFFDFY